MKEKITIKDIFEICLGMITSPELWWGILNVVLALIFGVIGGVISKALFK